MKIVRIFAYVILVLKLSESFYKNKCSIPKKDYGPRKFGQLFLDNPVYPAHEYLAAVTL